MLVIKLTVVVSSANVMMVLQACMATQSCVIKEYSSGLRTLLYGNASVEDQSGGDVKSNMQMLASVGEEIYSPIVQVFSEFQIAQICVELRWIHGLEG